MKKQTWLSHIFMHLILYEIFYLHFKIIIFMHFYFLNSSLEAAVYNMEQLLFAKQKNIFGKKNL